MKTKTTKKYNAKNERIKREYYTFLGEYDQKAEATINVVRMAIARFEEFSKYRDFITLHRDLIIAFKDNLLNGDSEKTGKPLSKATVNNTLYALRDFFRWLASQEGYKKKIKAQDLGYFCLTEKDTRIAKTPAIASPPTLQQVQQVLERMPTKTILEQRDRALFCFIAITGMRDKAIASLKIKHVDLQRGLVIQDPREVDTKFSKLIYTYFLPIGITINGVEPTQIIVEWIATLHSLGFTSECPLFPKNAIKQDSNNSFTSDGITNEHWKTTNAIRRIVKTSFEAANQPYYKPHLFRHMLVQHGQRICKTPEQFKAWSQNFGHKTPATTFTSYGELPPEQQGDVIKGIASNQEEGVTTTQLLDAINNLKNGVI